MGRDTDGRGDLGADRVELGCHLRSTRQLQSSEEPGQERQVRQTGFGLGLDRSSFSGDTGSGRGLNPQEHWEAMDSL